MTDRALFVSDKWTELWTNQHTPVDDTGAFSSLKCDDSEMGDSNVNLITILILHQQHTSSNVILPAFSIYQLINWNSVNKITISKTIQWNLAEMPLTSHDFNKDIISLTF